MSGRRLATVSLLGLAAVMARVPDPRAADEPTGKHFKIERPAELSKGEATALYARIAAQMARGFAASDNPTAEGYQAWRRYNDAPYRSASHGNRYVNNYANATAVVGGYGALGPGARLPTGAILAKDSFTVTGDNDVFGGALFIMEKLPAGTSRATGDWRYVMIMPDGSLFGDSTGATADTVAFCHRCHVAAAASDYLFFIPKGYRVPSP